MALTGFSVKRVGVSVLICRLTNLEVPFGILRGEKGRKRAMTELKQTPLHAWHVDADCYHDRLQRMAHAAVDEEHDRRTFNNARRQLESLTSSHKARRWSVALIPWNISTN